MSFSITAMVRLLVLLAVGSTLLAIGVSRLETPQPTRRTPRVVASTNVNDYFRRGAARRSSWIDSDTGLLSETPTPADDVLEAASCSPWVDGAGRRQAVGRWSNRTWEGPQTVCHAFGLARCSFPDGRMLDQVATDVVPVNPPCWIPGTRARVVFTAGDGQLYRFSFEGDGPLDSAAAARGTADERPTPVAWVCPKPGRGAVFIGDISWPEDPRMGGRLVASLRVEELDEAGAHRFTRMQLWWLRLNHSATRIVEAGPLVDHDVTGAGRGLFDERSPTVASLPDGSLGLAYARQVLGRSAWAAVLGRLETDADHHLMPARESRVRVVVADCQPAPLSFSTDGRWLNVLVGEVASDKSIARAATVDRPDPAAVAAAGPR